MARKLGIVTANLLDEAFGVLAPDECLGGIAERAGRPPHAGGNRPDDIRLRPADPVSNQEYSRLRSYRGGYLGRGVPDWRPRDAGLASCPRIAAISDVPSDVSS
jgi:hypothetical protein